MRAVLIVCVIVLVAATAFAKPMTGSVKSWEGNFKLQEEKISVQIQGRQTLFLWRYLLENDSKGTCIGFSRENGDMILAPRPNEKGVQPVYIGYSVLFSEKGAPEIIVMYDIQGNGGQRMLEKYVFDGKLIKLVSRSQYLGKHEPIWKNITGQSKDVHDKR